MAVLSDKHQTDSINVEIVENASILREERRNTGRYMAASTAIFLCLLGLYEALARGTPQYAALFLPAMIMFIYVMWILYSSKRSLLRKRELELLLASSSSSGNLEDGGQTKLNIPPSPPPPISPSTPSPSPQSKDTDTRQFIDKDQALCRTYSVA